MTQLSEQQAREVIAPWYSLFNIKTRGDVRAIQEAVLTDDYESCAGYLPGECWGREISIKVVSNFANTIPDMTFDIKEVLVAGDRVVVRGEVAGTPASELFGVPHTGRSFRIMAVDIQTIRDGRIAKTYHMENWLSAINSCARNRREAPPQTTVPPVLRATCFCTKYIASSATSEVPTTT
jgi:ketosteroid isomerase-like protein